MAAAKPVNPPVAAAPVNKPVAAPVNKPVPAPATTAPKIPVQKLASTTSEPKPTPAAESVEQKKPGKLALNFFEQQI